MNQKHYLYVSTLARELNFSHASEVLGITQPTLSQTIKKIERETGCELFLRNGTEVRLSEAGERYLEYGRELLAIEQRMRDSMDALKNYESGTLRMALSPSKCYTLMPRLIGRFRERYPGVRVQIREALAGELLRGLEDGEFEMGVTPMPLDASRYHTDVVLTEEIVVAVPRSLPVYDVLTREAVRMENREFPAVDFSCLSGQPFIVMQDWQVMQRQLAELCEETGIGIRPVVECTNNLTMLTMVQSGAGLSLIPSSAVPFSLGMNNDNVAYFSLTQPIPKREIVCIYKKNQKITEPAKFMLALLKEMR